MPLPNGIELTDEMRRTLRPLDRVNVRLDDGTVRDFEVKYAPWQLGDGSWVIGLTGIAGGYALERVTAVVSTQVSRGPSAYQPTPRQLRAGDVCAICRHRSPAVGKTCCDTCLPPDEGEVIARGRLAAVQAELDAAVNELRSHRESDRYLRNLFKTLAPQCECLGSPAGVATQLDNYIAGLRERVAELERALRYAAECWSLECVKDTARGMGVIA